MTDQTYNHYEVDYENLVIVTYEKRLDTWEHLTKATEQLERINCEQFNMEVNGYQVSIWKLKEYA